MKNSCLSFAVVVWTVEMVAAPFKVTVCDGHADSLYRVAPHCL